MNCSPNRIDAAGKRRPGSRRTDCSVTARYVTGVVGKQLSIADCPVLYEFTTLVRSIAGGSQLLIDMCKRH